MARASSNAIKHCLDFFGGGGNQNEVIDKNEVCEKVGMEGKTFAFVKPLLLDGGEEVLHSENE